MYLFPWVPQEYTFRHRSACRTPAESGQESLTSVKNIQTHAKLSRMKELEGKTGVLVRTGPALSGWGNYNTGLIPTLGQLSESEEKHLRLRVKQLICGSLNAMRIRQSLPQPYIPRTGTRVPWKAQQLGASLGSVEQSQGKDCC